MDLAFPEEIAPVFIEGEPEASYALVGFSLLLPYLEPYLIRTMRDAKPQVTDPELVKDLERFSAQEGQHYQQHRRFNETIRTQGFPRLARLEADLEADYQRFTREKSLRFNLAYAEGFEAMTTASALFSFETGEIGRMHPAAADLFMWHLVEELEHRTVAFDVYDHLVGSYPYRLAVGLFAQFHLVRFMVRVSRYMLEADPDYPALYGGREGRRERMRRRSPMLRRSFLPKLLRTYLPGYTPESIPFTDELRVVAERYSAMAVRTS